MIGCRRRLRGFFEAKSNRTVILPMDHGASDGMIQGIGEIPALLEASPARLVQGVVLNKGYARAYAEQLGPDVRLVVQLSAGTKHGLPTYNKSLVCTVPEALRLGADAVAVHVNIGNDLEDRMLSDLGLASDEAHQYGLPVLAVICPRGGQIVNELDPTLVAHCVRLGGELGADLVSVPYSGDPASFAAAVSSCPAPVLVAGGPNRPDFDSFVRMVGEALDCGAAGVNIGRNIFQHPRPLQALDKIVSLVHG